MTTVQMPDMKRGETLQFKLRFLNEGAVYAINVDDIRAEIRSKASGKLLAECAVSEVSTGLILFVVEDTEEFVIGDAECDIDYVIDDIKYSTPTYVFKVVRDITRPA